MKKAKSIIILIVILLAIIVILQNTQSVETKILFVTVTMPRALLLIVTFMAGITAGIFFMNYWLARSPKSQE
jgi:uncharacterized integral membrane protein